MHINKITEMNCEAKTSTLPYPNGYLLLAGLLIKWKLINEIIAQYYFFNITPEFWIKTSFLLWL